MAAQEEFLFGGVFSERKGINKKIFIHIGNLHVDNNPDFEKIWGDFFDKGGYNPILPHAVDGKPVNVRYINGRGETVYFQGMFVKEADKIPEGYKLMDFPVSEYFCVTTEWMESNETAG